MQIDTVGPGNVCKNKGLPKGQLTAGGVIPKCFRAMTFGAQAHQITPKVRQPLIAPMTLEGSLVLTSARETAAIEPP